MSIATDSEETQKSLIDRLVEFASSSSRINAICEGNPLDDTRRKLYYFLVNPPYNLQIERALMRFERELKEEDRFHLKEWAIRLEEIKNYSSLGECVWRR